MRLGTMLAGALLAGPTLAAASPNLLVLLVDDVGVDKVGAYADDVLGYRAAAAHLPDTPTLDGLADAGLRFTAAWATPLCSPTRASLLTGRHPWRTGVGDTVPEGPELDVENELTLADALADPDSGELYATGAFGKWHVGLSFDPDLGADWDLTEAEGGYGERAATAHPLRAGFAVYDGALGGSVESYVDWTRFTAHGPGLTVLTTETEHVTAVTVDSALTWIDAQTGPWLALVSFNAAHTSEDTESYTIADIAEGCHAVACIADGTCAGDGRSVYQAQVECLDGAIGELLDGIDPVVLADTVVVFASDNGSPRGVLEGTFANAGHRTENGKGSVYQTGIQVPLLITDGANWLEWSACTEAERAAGTCALSNGRVHTPGRTFRSPVSTTDLFATLAELAGRAPPSGDDALSFAPCLTNPLARCGGAATSPTRLVYSESFTHTTDADGAPVLASGRLALRRGTVKLVGRYARAEGCVTYELYDLGSDRFERNNLAASQPTTLRSMRSALDGLGVDWLAGLRGCPPA